MQPMNITPEPGNVVVELPPSDFGAVVLTEKTYDSVTNGKILSVHKDDEERYGYLVGRTAYWHKFKDDARVTGKSDARKIALIEIKDILGSSDD